MGSETRKRNTTPIYVRVSIEEKAQLQALADACSCSIPTLLRNVGLGHQVTSTLDQQAVLQLLALHADIGRIGGLLRLWLTQDEAWAGTGVGRGEIRALVEALRQTQAQLKTKILSL